MAGVTSTSSDLKRPRNATSTTLLQMGHVPHFFRTLLRHASQRTECLQGRSAILMGVSMQTTQIRTSTSGSCVSAHATARCLLLSRASAWASSADSSLALLVSTCVALTVEHVDPILGGGRPRSWPNARQNVPTEKPRQASSWDEALRDPLLTPPEAPWHSPQPSPREPCASSCCRSRRRSSTSS